MEKKTPWWRYAAAVIVFLLAYFFGPMLIRLFELIVDLFSPRYFKQGEDWAMIIGYLGAPFLAAYLTFLIVGGFKPLLIVLCALGGVYSVFVATWNYLVGVNDGFTSVFIGLGGAVSIGIAVWIGMNTATRKKETAEAGNEYHT